MTDDSEPEPTPGGTGAPPASGEGSRARDVDDADRSDVGTDESADGVAHADDAERADTAAEAAVDAGPAGDATEDPSEIDPSELTVARRSLNPRIRIIWVLRAVVTALIVGGLAHLADRYVFGVGAAVPAGVTAVALLLGVTHALLRYRVWSYEVREDALYLERGVVTRVRTVVPFVRIQHVDTSRGPVERATGLATSVVYTAGSRGADVTIPGLEADRADDLQHRLKRLAIASEADTAV